MTKSNSTRPPTAHITPFGLRMQPELKEKLERAASEANRSLNAEIVARLTESFAEHSSPADGQSFLRALVVEEIENYLNPGGKVLLELLKNLDKGSTDSGDSSTKAS